MFRIPVKFSSKILTVKTVNYPTAIETRAATRKAYARH